MASAVPLYQFSSMRCCGGSTSMYSSSSRPRKPQPAAMCRSRLRALYWVSTRMRRRPLLMQLDRVKSTMRYRPPKGTAGLARSRVNGRLAGGNRVQCGEHAPAAQAGHPHDLGPAQQRPEVRGLTQEVDPVPGAGEGFDPGPVGAVAGQHQVQVAVQVAQDVQGPD